MSDVPEPDAQEQAAVVDGETEPAPPRIDPEVPEADAIEQSQDLPDADEDYSG